MKRINKKTIAIVVVAALIIVAAILAYRADQPTEIAASPEWEASVSSSDLVREKFLVQSGDLQLEAELIMPVGGREVKPAVIFVPGSGDSLYQNYAGGLVEKYVQNVFFPRDMAVLYVNKRGMGQSEGNWLYNDFQGRADDIYAAVQYLQEHPLIDRDNIGLIGHSQGGWIAGLVAAQHDDVAFFVSLAGPTTTVEEQMEDMYENDFRCQGYEGAELERRTASRLNTTRFGASVGRIIPVGMIGFDAGIIDYDPREALQTVSSPGLLVFGENDALVPADQNLARFDEIFDRHPPEHLAAAVINDANHSFRLVDAPCTSRAESLRLPLSEELITLLHDWLTEQGN
jgi:pimeloyl-ACP methyl ester carboxylesterase